VISEFQRSRLLKAALGVACDEGYAELTATAVIARAGVSRKTFYDLFDNREECLLAVLEDALARIAAEVAPAYEAPGSWSQRLRAALVALLELLEREPDVGTFVVSCLLGCGPPSPGPRVRVLGLLHGIVDGARAEAVSRHEPASLTAEFVVGGVLAVIDARLRTPQPRLTALVNPLMWTIVLPYRGRAAASSELKRPAPIPPEAEAPSAVGPASTVEQPLNLNMRLTYRTGRVLEIIAATPDQSNYYVGLRAGITDPGQTSKLLTRLARLGLIENTGPGHQMGGTNSWRLTPDGEKLELAIRRRAVAGWR
jgi:AcrR family transcriptional regulator